MSEFSFRDLAVWQRGIDLSTKIYELTRGFPSSEKYGLCSQIRRAAVSVPANIAEGRGRGSTKDFLRFLGIAQGSLAEVATFVVIAEKLGYLQRSSSNEITLEIEELTKMLYGLQRSLRKRIS
jgi:four helix bundle protein